MNDSCSDKGTFHDNRCFNAYNLYYYATENPRIVREMDYQNLRRINVWGGIIGENVVGPYFFNGHVNAQM